MAVRFLTEQSDRSSVHQFTAQIIGVSSLGFNKCLQFNYASELPSDMELLLEGPKEYIEILRVWVGQSNIICIEAALTNSRTRCFGDLSKAQGAEYTSVREFRFLWSERIDQLEVYVNFYSRKPVQLAKREVHKSVDEEWKDACCCGLKFTTTKRRTFDVRPLSGFTFRTGYQVELHSGNFNGIIAKTNMNSEGNARIAALGFVFLDGSETCQSIASFRHVKQSWWNTITDTLKMYIQPKEYLQKHFPLLNKCLESIRKSRRLRVIRGMLVQILIPLFDVVSDFWVASIYYRRGYVPVALIIMLFTFLPHLIYTITYAIEGVLGSSEWSVYTEGVLGSIYNYECSGIWFVDVLIKILIFPFHVLWVSLHFHLGLVRRALEIIRLARSRDMSTDSVRHQPFRNLRTNEWARSLILEFWFESIPQLIFQTTMFFVLLREEESESRSLSLYSSLVASSIMTIQQSVIVRSFLKTTKLSRTNLLRLILSDYLSFFPIISIFRDSVEELELEDYDERLRDLWGALCQVLRVNRSLKKCVLSVKKKSDPWLINAMEVLEALLDNTSIRLHLLEVRFIFEVPMNKEYCEVLDHVCRSLVLQGRTKALNLVFLRQVDIYQEEFNPNWMDEGEVKHGDLVIKWKAPGRRAMKYIIMQSIE
eukprot:g4669.t1